MGRFLRSGLLTKVATLAIWLFGCSSGTSATRGANQGKTTDASVDGSSGGTKSKPSSGGTKSTPDAAGGHLPPKMPDAAPGSGGHSGNLDARAPGGPDAQTAPPVPAVGVTTHHNDNARTGQNTGEMILTPANVNSTQFGRLFSAQIDGYAYTEPLVVLGVNLVSGTRDLVYVATEHDSVYAFDADAEGPPVWHVSFLGNGVTPVPPADTGETADLVPEIGISGTPVIDLSTNTLYVVAKTKESGPSYFYRLHALDVATGAEKFGGPVVVQAHTSGSGADNAGGVVTFDALHDLQRPALLLSGGVVYVAFGDHGDHYNWHGWVLGYDKGTLAQKYVFCTTPDANEASVWQSGAGIATDPSGNLYIETGNGDFDGQSGGRDFAMSVIKLSPAAAVLDWFTPHDYSNLSDLDVDLGSSGPLVLPDQSGAHPHLAIGSGKPGLFYLLDRDQMGHFHAGDDSQIVQTVSVKPNTTGITSGLFASPAYWNGRIYVAAVDDSLKAFELRAGLLTASPVSKSSSVFGFPGATPSVSSNGATAGIVWIIEGDGYTPSNPGVLHAYDATDLTKELYSSDQAANGRDTSGPAVKYAVPAVVNGHVYVASQTELDVYGELSH